MFSDNCNRICFGPTISLSIDSTPLDAFHTLLSVDAMSNIILQWTERFRRDQCPHYAVITMDELNAFLGLLILYGTIKSLHTRLRDIWNTKVGVQYVHAVMSENRFKQILRCLRFDDPDTRERRKRTSRLAPFQELMSYLNTQFQNFYAMSGSVIASQWSTFYVSLIVSAVRCGCLIRVSTPSVYSLIVAMTR